MVPTEALLEWLTKVQEMVREAKGSPHHLQMMGNTTRSH